MISKYILGVKVTSEVTMKTAIEEIERLLKTRTFNLVCTTNPEFIIDAQGDTDFKAIINNAKLSLPDGVGILFAHKYYDELERFAKYKHTIMYPIIALYSGASIVLRYFAGRLKVGEVVTGVSLVDNYCNVANEKGYNVFLLGGWPKDKFGKSLSGEHDIALDTSNVLLKKYPKLKIVGATSQFSYLSTDDEASVTYIKECMKKNNINVLDVILVAYGHKKQERWLVRNGSKIPVSVGIGVGGTFDYITGNQPLPNEYIKSWHLEWLYRLVTQPWRIHRIIKAFPIFPLKVFFNSIRS